MIVESVWFVLAIVAWFRGRQARGLHCLGQGRRDPGRTGANPVGGSLGV